MPQSSAHSDFLKTRLAMTRQMTSLIDRSFIAAGPDMHRTREDWVPGWVDMGHRVQGSAAEQSALRAIDDDGRLMWMVHTTGKARAFHSAATDPVAAMEEASVARQRRRMVKANWDEVKRLQSAALAGKLDMRVDIEDAPIGGLCALGTTWFMRRMGLARVRSLSARTTALLGMIEPQVLHVLYAAATRQGVSSERGLVGAAPAH